MKKSTRMLLLFSVICLFTISCSKKENIATADTVTDIDGNVYHTVKIGTQTWMVENLKTTKYRNGDPIPNVTNGTAWEALTSGAYSYYDAAYNTTYGNLYNGYAVTDSRNIAPKGWHVPSDTEWKTLIKYLDANADFTDISGGYSLLAGVKLKEAGIAHWRSPNDNATNETGFTALPSGWRIQWCCGYSGMFDSIGTAGFWFSNTVNVSEPGKIWVYSIQNGGDEISRSSYPVLYGLSVRCVKD